MASSALATLGGFPIPDVDLSAVRLQNLRQASIVCAIALSVSALPSSLSVQAVAQEVYPPAAVLRVQGRADWPRPTVTITADRTTINKGDSVILSWRTTDAYNVVITPDIGAVTPQGSTIVKPAESTTYNITAAGPGGSVDASIRISVSEPPPHMPAMLSPQELFKRVSPSIFVVEVLDQSGSLVASGSAVAVETNNVVTNKHVIDGATTVEIRQGSRTWPATLTHIDPDHDLCILTAEGFNAQIVPVRLSSALTVGERVYSIGAPEGLELTISEGLISGLREFDEGRLIQTSAAISPGSSGGGLFDADGQLIGITTFFLKGGQNLNFALPGEWVKVLAARQIPAKKSNEATSSGFDALSYYELGSQMLDAGKYEEAGIAFLNVVRLRPDYVDGWFALGFAHAELHQYDKAIAEFQRAIRLKPSYADVWNNLGFVYKDSGEYDKAVPALQEAVRLKPDDVMAWYNLGECYAVQGNRSKVMEVYKKLRTLDQKSADEFFRDNVHRM